MFKSIIDKIEKIDQNYPYLSVIVYVIVGSLLGITMQYLINGNLIRSGIYSAIFMMIILLISRWIRQRRNKK